MTPGGPTWPAENRESDKNVDKISSSILDDADQVHLMKQYCKKVTEEQIKSVTEYVTDKNPAAKSRLVNALTRKIQSPKIRQQFGIKNTNDVEKFLQEKGFIEGMLLWPIEDNHVLRNKVRIELINNTLDKISEEFPALTQQQREKLWDVLKAEDNNRFTRSILENYRTRRSFVQRELRVTMPPITPAFSFDNITEKILKLDPTKPWTGDIQDAWKKIISLAKPGETLRDAFRRVSEEGRPQDFSIAGAYEMFFSDSNTCLGIEEKNQIRSFLVKHFVPVLPFNALKAIAPAISEETLFGPARVMQNESVTMEEAVKMERDEAYNTERRRLINEEYYVDVSKLHPKLQEYILGVFGNESRSEKLMESYRWKPFSLWTGTSDRREEFRAVHWFYPEKLSTQEKLVSEMQNAMKDKITNIENFKPWNVMEWHTLWEDNQPMIGYFFIDDVLNTAESENIAGDDILKFRWLGNNRAPLHKIGSERPYTATDFFHYIRNCGENGKIVFREWNEFEADLEKNSLKEEFPRYENNVDIRNSFYDSLSQSGEQMNIDVFQYTVDTKLQDFPDNNAREAKTPEERKLQPGSIITLSLAGEVNTIHVQDIDEELGTITLWDWHMPAWTEWPENVSLMTVPFSQFIDLLDTQKNKGAKMTRLPTGNKFWIEEFNSLFSNDKFNNEFHNKLSQVRIQDWKFGKYIEWSGFTEMPFLKIKGSDGKPQDIWIKNIHDDGTAEVMIGAFHNHDFDKDTAKLIKNAYFEWSSLTMPLANLWAYIQSNINFQFEAQKKAPDVRPPESPMSWLSIFKHAHSLWVFLHGDLWKAPLKAWEEQHNKEHAFHGKLTAALAMEKLKGRWPAAKFLNWVDWPANMIADSNTSFQSYLWELIKQIEDQGSTNRVKLINKWAGHHFPDIKFMAAMMGSMQVFGHLYPREGQFKEKDPRYKKPWFWYNSMIHALWRHDTMPKDEHGHGVDIPDEQTEMQMIIKLMQWFQHPILADLKRRFEKYMNAWFKDNREGWIGNLEMRERMEDKYDWMVANAVGDSRQTEAMAHPTSKIWYGEWFDIVTTSGPAMAFLLAHGEQSASPMLQSDMEDQFKNQSIKHPALLFAQSKKYGDIFRDVSISYAYTISKDCGDRMSELANAGEWHGRLFNDVRKAWTPKFKAFWAEYGEAMMGRLTGMKDPLLQIMMTDPKLFDNEIFPSLPDHKKARYERLMDSQHRRKITTYYERLKEFNSSASYAGLKWSDGAFYKWDHFRFRPWFISGFPMAWMDWNGYFDANGAPEYFKDPYKSDGVFKEMREFVGEIPRLAETMVDQMGITGSQRKVMIDKISESLYKKNVEKIGFEFERWGWTKWQPLEKAYYCVPSWILWLDTLDRFSPGPSASPERMKMVEWYEHALRTIIDTAKKKESTEGFAAAIRYRHLMWPKCVELINKTAKPEELLAWDSTGTNLLQKKFGSKTSKTLIPSSDDFLKQATNKWQYLGPASSPVPPTL